MNNQSTDKKPSQDINDVCRLCMAKNATVSIFPDNSFKTDNELPLVCKIMSTVNIQASSLCSYFYYMASRKLIVYICYHVC